MNKNNFQIIDYHRNDIDEDLFEYVYLKDDVIDEVIEEYLRLYKHLLDHLKIMFVDDFHYQDHLDMMIMIDMLLIRILIVQVIYQYKQY